jgi:hypothetical protein
MKKEKRMESEISKVPDTAVLENEEQNRLIIKEEKSFELSISRIKKDNEITNSLPLSFDILDKEYNQVVKETSCDNYPFHQVPTVLNQSSNLHNLNASNFNTFERSSSPFIVDVHRLSFNNMDFNFPPGRALVFNSNK